VTEGVTIQEFGQEDHGRDIGMIWTHASHGEGDDSGVSRGGDELSYHGIESTMHIQHGPGGQWSRRVSVEGSA